MSSECVREGDPDLSRQALENDERLKRVVRGYLKGADRMFQLLDEDRLGDLQEKILSSTLNLQSHVDLYTFHAYLYYVKHILGHFFRLTRYPEFNVHIYQKVQNSIRWGGSQTARHELCLSKILRCIENAEDRGYIDLDSFPGSVDDLLLEFLDLEFPVWRQFTAYQLTAALFCFFRAYGIRLKLREMADISGVSASNISINCRKLGYPLRQTRPQGLQHHPGPLDT